MMRGFAVPRTIGLGFLGEESLFCTGGI